MGKIKPFKTVEQIAKKHRLDVSFVKKQLDMGEPIEHEHTKDHELARKIALQHLDEIPDYYTKLKKMEASAKKEHQKFKDVFEGKKGLWDNIHARRKAGKPRKKPGEKGYPKTLDIEEGFKQARKNVGAANWGEEYDGGDGTDDMDNPMHIHFHDGVMRFCPACQKNEKASECKYGKKYWRMFSHPTNMASDKHYTPNTPHPGNMPEGYDHEYSMARSEISTIISAAKRLKSKIGKGEGNLEAWVQSKITKAADYLDTAADYVDSGEMKEEATSVKKPATPEERKRIRQIQTLHRLTTSAKLGRSFSDVGRVPKESVSIEDANGNYYAEFIDIIKPEPLKPSKGIGSDLLGEKCWDGYTQKGMKKKRKKMVPNCVPAESKKSFGEFMVEASAAWQRKAGKNPEGGLNKKGIASYRKEHPGSHLSLAVTTKPSKLKKGSKSAKRRKSFCSRMKGMKAKLTSKKTARDPNSRINKSLRKWNC